MHLLQVNSTGEYLEGDREQRRRGRGGDQGRGNRECEGIRNIRGGERGGGGGGRRKEGGERREKGEGEEEEGRGGMKHRQKY